MPQLVQAAMMAAFGTGEGEGMSSYANIKINGHELVWWQNSYYEWYFSKSERVRQIIDRPDGELDENTFIGYRTTVGVIRRRLKLDGYDLEFAKQDFEHTRNIWIADMKDSLVVHNGLDKPRSENKHDFYNVIEEQLEIVQSTSFQDWYDTFLKAKELKSEYTDYSYSFRRVEIDGEPLLSLMLSTLYGVSENNNGYLGPLFPCMNLETNAVLLLEMSKDDDICELDITDLVYSGWVDDFEDIEQLQEGKTHFYKIFENSLIELNDIKLDESTPVLQRMIFSSVITTMEAYLSDTLKKNVLNRDAIKKKFVKNSESLKRSRNISLNDIYEALDTLDERIIDEIDSISYHNVDVVTGLYKNVLLCSFPEDKIAQLKTNVEIRHDIVHRNGHKKDGSIIHIVKEDVENLITLVSDVVSHIDKQILDGLLDTGEQY
ncbi:HEPN/Toprim-associated domain-containing protein [Aeromonas caviae]|uniref:HEPN/Toprim-associated domain-containing protein n=1 Tax=Aeromonas caviae TaxID=648 RepID=UPI0030145D78